MGDLPAGKRTLTLAELLQKAIAARLLSMHTAMPARVESYDPVSQTANVVPLIQTTHRNELAEDVIEALPVIARVPVVFPGAGGMRITFPIAEGDTVLLVFSESSLDVWQTEGGGPVNPRDVRRFHLNDAIAIPGLHDDHHPWHGAEAGVVTIGKDDQPADFVALAAKVEAQLAALQTAIAGAAVTAGDGGLAFKTAILAALAALVPPWPGPVASATVKIKG